LYFILQKHRPVIFDRNHAGTRTVKMLVFFLPKAIGFALGSNGMRLQGTAGV
jgi:hypothetical protein